MAPDVLGDDDDSQAAICVIFLGQARPVLPAYAHLSATWRASLVGRLGEDGAAQLIGSSVNPLADTSAADRRTGLDWCIAHPPQG